MGSRSNSAVSWGSENQDLMGIALSAGKHSFEMNSGKEGGGEWSGCTVKLIMAGHPQSIH